MEVKSISPTFSYVPGTGWNIIPPRSADWSAATLRTCSGSLLRSGTAIPCFTASQVS